MTRMTVLALAGVLLATTATAASATSFTATTETPDGMGFIDTDTIKVDGPIGKATTYFVTKDDQPIPAPIEHPKARSVHALVAQQVWFQCETKHYSIVQMFFYDSRGDFIAAYDHPVLVDEAIPPQTGLEEQFEYVCKGTAPTNRLSQFNDNETPIQTIIRAARVTMHDPRYAH